MPDFDEMLDEVLAEARSLDGLLVRDELRKLRARAEAKRLYRLETEKPMPAPEFVTIAQLARRTFNAPSYRVQGLLATNGNTLLTAARKSGKTTLILNLARCVLSGEPFLGCFDVTPLTGNVVILNYEVAEHMAYRWAVDIDIPGDRCAVVTLRGRRNPLMHPDDRAHLAEQIRDFNTEMLIVDPFSNAFTGSDQNSTSEVRAFLSDLEEFARTEAGVADLVLTNHAGWDGSRSRGSSALEDWPDSLLLVEREKSGDKRYLSADGRDVALPKGELQMDPDTRLLTWWEQDPRAAAGSQLEALAVAIANVAKDRPGIGSVQLAQELKSRQVSHRKENVQPARDLAAANGWIRVEVVGQKHACYPPAEPLSDTENGQPSPPPQPSPNPPRGESHQPSPPPPTFREGEGEGMRGGLETTVNPPQPEGGQPGRVSRVQGDAA